MQKHKPFCNHFWGYFVELAECIWILFVCGAGSQWPHASLQNDWGSCHEGCRSLWLRYAILECREQRQVVDSSHHGVAENCKFCILCTVLYNQLEKGPKSSRPVTKTRFILQELHAVRFIFGRNCTAWVSWPSTLPVWDGFYLKIQPWQPAQERSCGEPAKLKKDTCQEATNFEQRSPKNTLKLLKLLNYQMPWPVSFKRIPARVDLRVWPDESSGIDSGHRKHW